MRYLLGLIVGLFLGVLWARAHSFNPWPAWGVLVAMLASGSFGLLLGALMAARNQADDLAVHIRPQPLRRVR